MCFPEAAGGIWWETGGNAGLNEKCLTRWAFGLMRQGSSVLSNGPQKIDLAGVLHLFIFFFTLGLVSGKAKREAIPSAHIQLP